MKRTRRRFGHPVLVAGAPCGPAVAFAAAALALAAMAGDAPSLVTATEGTLPIVFSVPHAGAAAIPGVPPRTGVGVSRFVTAADTRADRLAELTAAALDSATGGRPFLVIARFARRFIDVNRLPEDADESELAKPVYDADHQAVAAACRAVLERWGRGLLVDIHGQATETNAIFRGTADGLTVTNLLARFGEAALCGPHSVLGQLAGRGYRVIPPLGDMGPECPRYRGGYIVRTHGAHTPGGLDAIQLEFGAHFRRRENLERTAADLAAALAVFARTYLPTRPLNNHGAPPAGSPRSSATDARRDQLETTTP